MPAARADAAEAQGRRFRRHFVSSTAPTTCTISFTDPAVINEHYFRHARRRSVIRELANARSCARRFCYPRHIYGIPPLKYGNSDVKYTRLSVSVSVSSNGGLYGSLRELTALVYSITFIVRTDESRSRDTVTR